MKLIALILILVIALGAAFGGDLLIKEIDEAVYPQEYAESVSKYSAKYNIPEYLIYAVIKVESNFDPLAESSAGARGLMQMTESTFKWLTGSSHLGEHLPFEALFIPDVSIRYGTYYLNYLLRQFDHNTNTVLAAYNAGETRVKEWLSDSEYTDGNGGLSKIPFAETRNYVKKVNKAIDKYKELYYKENEGVLT